MKPVAKAVAGIAKGVAGCAVINPIACMHDAETAIVPIILFGMGLTAIAAGLAACATLIVCIVGFPVLAGGAYVATYGAYRVTRATWRRDNFLPT